MPTTVEEVLGNATQTVNPKNFSWEGVIRVVALVVIGLVLIRVIQKLLERMLSRSKLPSAMHRYVLLAAKVVLWTILVLSVLGSVGAEVTSVIALLSVAGLAVSMALQNTLSNMAGGIMLLVVKPFQVGHYIAAGGVEGTVSTSGLSYTTLVTVDNREIIIPNSELASGKIINYSSLGRRRLDLTFSSSYDDSTKDTIEALKDALAHVPQILQDPEPIVHLKEYQSSCIVYETRSWILASDYWTAYFAVQEEVREAFLRHNVHMTYDRLTVHVVDHE